MDSTSFFTQQHSERNQPGWWDSACLPPHCTEHPKIPRYVPRGVIQQLQQWPECCESKLLMTEGSQESLLVLRKSRGSTNFCKDFSTVISKSYLTRTREGGSYVVSCGFGSFFLQELRCCIVQSCLEETESWYCTKERLVELIQFSGKVRELMCFQGLGFLWSFFFFFLC